MFFKKVATEVVKNSITNKKVIGVAVVAFVAYQAWDFWKIKKATELGDIAADKKINEEEKK